MRYYLATTAIPEIWDLDEKLLLLGPWCLTDEENKEFFEDNKGYIFVPSPWKPGSKIKEAADYCHEIYERLLPQLSDSLNSIHQVSYPVRYWRVLLGPWLLHFIGVFYDRYKRIEKALELFPDFYTSVLPNSRCELVSYDTYDCLDRKIKEDYYNLKLFSIIAYDLCPHNIIVKEYKAESKMQMHRINYSWKIKLFNKLIKSLDLFFKCPIALCDMYHLTPHDMILLKLKDGFKTFRFMHSESIKKGFARNEYSYEFRKELKLKEVSDRFQSLLYKVLPEAMPMCYMENYKIYKDSIKDIKGLDSVKIVGSSVGWFCNERFKFFAAEAVANGTSLIDFQHGGGYGISLAVTPEILSLEKDIFYTWGWSLNINNKTKPFPNPHLSRLKDAHLPRLDNILFVGTDRPRQVYRFHSQPLPEDMPKYFEDKKMFFQALTDQIRNRILYRPYTEEYGWKELDIVKKMHPNAKFVLKGRLVEWMQKVRLVVIDHPTTSFIEALTINVPCIFFWDHKVYLMRAEAERYFDLLREAEILFRDPLSAAKKVKEISNDPMSWWMKDSVQKARAEFCKQYAYNSKDWMRIWIEEFKQLIYRD